MEKKNLEKLKNVFKYEGALAVSELPPEYVAAFRLDSDDANVLNNQKGGALEIGFGQKLRPGDD